MSQDYKKLGLRAGLEIHQQLDTRKLFCNCQSEIQEGNPAYRIRRELFSVVGETGEHDIAAMHEQTKQKYYVYEGYRKSTCLVETDEDPPGQMNKNALNIALQISLMLHATPVDEVQVMRKNVVDGSNTAGFQRTSLVARNGYIESSLGKISIPTICLEEDSAKIVSRTKECDTYNLSRLGIPLIEIGTAPEITTPEQLKEVAENLGMVLRSTGKVKRGLGTIRQDVNVSIAGGNRVEIKGAQDLKLLSTLVELECIRQENLIGIKKSLLGKWSQPQIHDVTETFTMTSSPLIKKMLDKHGVVLGIKLAGFAGFLGKEVQVGRRLGTEFSDYAKAASGVGGILHSDEEFAKYQLTEKEWNKIKERLGCTQEDAFVLVADTKEKAAAALLAVVSRAGFCYEGVPKEVRKANMDGTTTFMRPLPGAARMYPETDVLPVQPDVAHIKLPELLSEKIARFENMGMAKDLATLAAKSEEADLFEEMVSVHTSLKPSFIAETLLATPKNVAKKIKKEVNVSQEEFKQIFAALSSQELAKESLEGVFEDIANHAFDLSKYALMSDEELEAEVKLVISENKSMPLNALLGKAMGKLRGKASGQKIVEMVKRLTS